MGKEEPDLEGLKAEGAMCRAGSAKKAEVFTDQKGFTVAAVQWVATGGECVAGRQSWHQEDVKMIVRIWRFGTERNMPLNGDLICWVFWEDSFGKNALDGQERGKDLGEGAIQCRDGVARTEVELGSMNNLELQFPGFLAVKNKGKEEIKDDF